MWGTYFNATSLADSALNQILAYTPIALNFAWHGSAFGYGDFGNNGVIRGNERVLQVRARPRRLTQPPDSRTSLNALK